VLLENFRPGVMEKWGLVSCSSCTETAVEHQNETKLHTYFALSRQYHTHTHSQHTHTHTLSHTHTHTPMATVVGDVQPGWVSRQYHAHAPNDAHMLNHDDVASVGNPWFRAGAR
jgi:hypothetical protein